ncbi:MAG: FAD-dependent oxidoreductase, partial [Planctomycetes bacterium]|nr:FAD-dependent oxidoreductase [Planctomycetota bacterium]
KLLGLSETPEEAGPFDLVVTGGGTAGTCAALSGARLGLKVALIQDRPVLGGNNSSEVRVWLQGTRNKPPYPRVGDVVRELEQKKSAHYGPTNTAEIYEDGKKLALVRAEPNLALFLDHRVNAAETDAGRITAVVAQNTKTGQRVRFTGRWFADCTGDGAVGFLAGADYDITLKGHMGRCNLWNAAETDGAQSFPRCPWALDLSDKPFPGRSGDRRGLLALGGWYWESGFDHDPIAKREYIRDWNFRAMYGAWDALKNVDKLYPNHKLNWAAHISGKRESRRLLGDVVLSKEDLLTSKVYPDGCVPTGWKIDVHLPHPQYEKGFEGDAFIAQAHFTDYPKPYWVPYRCLYSRNVDNLLMAGRDVSVTHDALGTVRVMKTGGCMGEIVGMSASLCKLHDTDPRGVHEKHLDDLKELMTQGVGKMPEAAVLKPPAWKDDVGKNIAPAAKATSSGDMKPGESPPQLVNDGRTDLADNTGRWLSAAETPNWLELGWPEPQALTAARIISGFTTGGEVQAPLTDFVLQYHDGDDWQDIAATRTAGNEAVDWQCKFPAVTTQRVRLLVEGTQIDVSRIWEIEVYSP